MTYDEQIGKNITRIREAAGMSQKGLAAEVKKYGFKWSQATVWSVESGARPVRLTEAQAVADVFEVNLPTLLRDADHGFYEKLANELDEKLEALKQAETAYASARKSALAARDRIKDPDLAESFAAHLDEHWQQRWIRG